MPTEAAFYGLLKESCTTASAVQRPFGCARPPVHLLYHKVQRLNGQLLW